MAGGARPAETTLLERGEELARIQQAVTALSRGQGGALVIQGAAGIGKSALLHILRQYATDQGIQTLTAQASELERDFGFGVVRQLLETRVVRADESEQTELLSGAAGLAGPVLGLSGSVGDPFAVLHGLYWLVANLAVGGPVVVAVDDLHWADESSLRWLIYLCRRREGLPVLVAASSHPQRPGYSSLLAELLALSGVHILFPGPLSERAIAQLICERLGAQPDPVFVAACAKATGGNPFVLNELIVDLATDSVIPGAEQAALARRVPARVERAVVARLGRLDQAAARLARAVAVLGERTELRLAAALAKLEIDVAAEAADGLVAAELLAEGRPLRFAHPLVRSAINEQIPSGARAQAHARAAQLLASEGAAPEHVAVQLLACDPADDADAVEALRAAAAAAVRRGAPETAMSYLRRALAEPPTESVRVAILGELGGAERVARDPGAVVHLEQAWRATTEPVARARLARQLANVLLATGNWTRGLAVLQTGLADLGDHDPDLAVRLHADKGDLELRCGASPPEAPEVVLGRLRELAAGISPASRAVQLTLAAILAHRGENCDQVAGLVERGLDGGRFLAEETSDAMPTILAGFALVRIDEFERARVLSEAMLADAQARGSVFGFVAATGRRGVVALRCGDLAEAEADFRAVLELAATHDFALSVAHYSALLGLTLLERGDLDQAAAVVEGVTLSPAVMETPFGSLLVEARGWVRLARGQPARAVADLRHCQQILAGMQVSPNAIAWRSALALALAPEEPREARELAMTELELARRAGSSRATGIALRVCGLLAGGQEGLELLEQSVTVLEPTPMRLELAHSLTEWGAALRRAGARSAAREPLRRALDLAARCGATPLVERAREEALAAGARPRRPWSSGVHALTPSELRVARLAAQALGNREIAQALFITTKTVSDHLTSAYRKLNISSRDQLATAMK